MPRQPNQILMFSDVELSLINNTFAEKDDLLYLIRNVLLQFPITEADRKRLKSVMNKEVYAVVKKRIFPDIDPESPFSQLADFYQTLTNDLQRKGVEEMDALFEAKELEYKYLKQQFEVLKNLDKEVDQPIKLADLASLTGLSARERYVRTTARNYLLAYVDGFLVQLKTLAGQKKETVEDQKKRLERNSNK